MPKKGLWWAEGQYPIESKANGELARQRAATLLHPLCCVGMVCVIRRSDILGFDKQPLHDCSTLRRELVRHFRRLPPVLRVAAIYGLLSILAGLAILLSPLLVWFHSFSPPPFWLSSRVLDICLNLLAIGNASTLVVNAYCLRFRHAAPIPALFNSWSTQVRAIALLVGLPLCTLVVALVIPAVSVDSRVLFLLLVPTAAAQLALILGYAWLTTKTGNTVQGRLS